MKMSLVNSSITKVLLTLAGFFMLALSSSIKAESALSVMQLEYKKYPQLRYLDATIEAVQQATISAQTSGRITEITVDTDDYVSKGMVIIKLRDKEQQATYRATRSSYEEAEADNTRIKQIYQQKLIARSELDKSEARLKSAKSAHVKAQEELENTVIRAPYSGIVVKRLVEVGEIAQLGTPLMTGLSLEKLRATVEVPQSLVHIVRKQKSVSVMINAHNEQTIKADAITISPYADSKSHTFTMRLNLPSGDHGLYPGMFVKVKLITGEQSHLVMPFSAVVQRGEVTLVYVSDEHQRLRLRQIRLGRKISEQEILDQPAVEIIEVDNQQLKTKTLPETVRDKPMAMDLVEVLAGVDEGESIVLDPIRATLLIKQQQRVNATHE